MSFSLSKGNYILIIRYFSDFVAKLLNFGLLGNLKLLYDNVLKLNIKTLYQVI